jgi:hypothetical protein
MSNENGAPIFKNILDAELLGVLDSTIIEIGLGIRSRDKGTPLR